MYSSYGYDTELIKGVALLDKYKCRICKDWKPNSFFSNKELKDYQLKFARNKKINGVSADLRCRNCSGAQVQELQCLGHCGETKPISEFSKAQRKNNSAHWCQECVLWKEAAEPGVMTAAAPETELAPDEHVNGPNAGAFFDETKFAASRVTGDTVAGSYTGSNAGYGFDASSSQVGTIATGADLITIPFHALGVEDGPAKGKKASAPSPSVAATSTTQLPPHLRHLKGIKVTQSQTASASIVTAPSIASSVSNPYEDTTSVASSASTIVGARVGTRAAPIPFNAYDNNGVKHAQQRVPSGTAASAWTIPQVSTAAAVDRGNWARAQGQKRTAPQFPVSRPVQPAVRPQTQVKHWGVPKEEKTYYSDGESEDEM